MDSGVQIDAPQRPRRAIPQFRAKPMDILDLRPMRQPMEVDKPDRALKASKKQLEDMARDRAAWDLAHPEDPKRRLDALKRYERCDSRIEARHLANPWKKDPTWSGAKRQAEFEVWKKQLEVAIQHAKKTDF